MNKAQLIELLQIDLTNEYLHMHFYLYSASVITGLHRQELREFLLNQAKEEMSHVTQFSDLIIGLGGKLKHTFKPYPVEYVSPNAILDYAIYLEEQVIYNYIERIEHATALGGVDGKWIEVFLEEQLMHSRADLDNLRMLVK